MKILILGGTRFLGRHLADAAIAAGHEVTLFNRGESAAAPAGMESLKGDRDGGLDPLRGRTWDVCIDTSGYVPRIVRASAELLADSVEHYTFVSSLSVVADASAPSQNEDAAVAKLEDESVEEVTGETYGGLKRLCEMAVEDVFGDRALIVRPGLIVGPYDTTDRFPYWPRRIARGGTVLAPGSAESLVQFIDARDLAAWTLKLAADRTPGLFHTTGPATATTLGAFLQACSAAFDASPTLTWVSEEFLLENKVAPYSEMPLWIPVAMRGFNAWDCSKASAAGLTYRPMRDTIVDTYAWDSQRTDEERSGKGHRLIGASLAPEREQELLDMWRSKSASV